MSLVSCHEDGARAAGGPALKGWTTALVVVCIVAAGCMRLEPQREANRQLALRYFAEVANRGRMDVADEILAPDVHFTNPPGAVTNREDFKKEIVAGLRTRFPDVRFTVADAVSEGDIVAVRWTMTGTRADTGDGQPGAGKRVHVTGMDFFRISDGRIREIWVNMDVAGMRQQLGIK